MADDFLKKISPKKDSNQNNPFAKMFNEKTEKLFKDVPKEKEEDETKDIQNLGTSTTDKPEEREPIDNTIKDEPQDIPSKDMAREDLFKNMDEQIEHDNFTFDANSSTRDLFFDDPPTDSNDKDKKIEHVVKLLKENNVAEALKYISENFKK